MAALSLSVDKNKDPQCAAQGDKNNRWLHRNKIQVSYDKVDRIDRKKSFMGVHKT